MNRKLLATALLLAVGRAAAAQDAPPPGPPPEDGPPGYVSPMGEPIRGVDGTELWFRAADADHDDTLSSAEFVADSRRFFKTLDTNGDGEIDAAEMKRYEEDVLRPVRGGPRGMAGPGGGHRGRPPGGGGGAPGGGGRRGPPGGMLEQPQPVASADTDMNRRVTADEFDKAAMRRFQRLDADQNRKVTLDEVRRAK